MEALNVQNPQQLIWQYEELRFAVLGGIRLEGLDRMRVTLKIDFKTLTVRHNLDMYNDSQLEKLVRKCAERFEIGTVYINKAMGELLNKLEAYRMEELAKEQKPEEKRTLSKEEEEVARTFLSAPNVLSRTNELIAQSGMTGEENNRLLLYLIFTSRKREHPLHAISLAASGTGKSYLQERVSELIPEEDRIEITTLSENALYYFGQQELKHKLILIEDLDGAENVLYPLRELKSKRKITKTVSLKDSRGNTKTVHLTVEGPVCVAGCTTRESIYEDNANRSFLIYLDESKEQDEEVMAYQRRLSAGKINQAAERQAKELLKNAQRLLKPVTVRNPYAEELHIPQEVFRPRRTNAHYLAFIEAITFYKQYQRKQQTDKETGEIYIETTIEDIHEANKLMKEVLLRKSDELSGAARNYLEKLKAHLHPEASPSGGGLEGAFTSSEISKALRIPISTVKRYHRQLVSNGYLRQLEPEKGEKSYRYQVISYEEYQELQSRIVTALDAVLEKISKVQFSSSLSAQSTTEPVKPKSINKKVQQPSPLAEESKA